MQIVRISKVILVASIALFATLVVFGNLTDYNSNFDFVRNVLSMSTIFPTATIRYRAVHSEVIHHIGYWLIITGETLTAILCWRGAYAMWTQLKQRASAFHRAKALAIAGLTMGFLVWQVGFMSVGGEWFGMWMSKTWNGIDSAFKMFMTILAVMIYVNSPDDELETPRL